MEVNAARPLRADAQRSRERLVSAAAEVFLRDGADGSLEEIARSAGVGSATLHRHFPSRWVLLDAVFADTIRALCDEAAVNARTASPAVALDEWLRSVCGYFTKIRGLAAALLQARQDDHPASCEACNQALVEAGEPLLERAIAAGLVRTDVTIEELLTLVGAVAVAAEYGPISGERLLSLAFDGLGPK